MDDSKGRSTRNDAPIRRMNIDDEMELEHNEFAELLQDSMKQSRSGEMVTGTVVQVSQDLVLVDIGRKAEGCIPTAELTDENGQVTVEIGDEVSAFLERGTNSQGYYILSKKKADRQLIWDRIAETGGEGGTIEGKITGKVKGGLTVDIGVPAFLPASQVDLRPGGNLDRYVGLTGTFKIIKLNRKRGNIVLSRRALLEEERDKVRLETLSVLAEGQLLEGVVKNITDYGAFVDLGGIDGLLHVTDMSWGRVGHPSELIKVGDTVKVVVLKFDREKEKISLGMKQALPDPWITIANRYSAGERVKGKVVSLTEYGAFIALEDGVEGLVHVSEMSWTRRVRHPSEILTVGDEVETVVLNVDTDSRRISLGLKQTEVNPWTIIGERYPVGTKIEGEIKNITDFGMFIGVEDGIDGLVHVSDISWLKRVKHPGELYTKGQVVQAVVLNIDVANERLSLGIKQLEADPWSEIPVRYRPGTKVKGKVTSITDFGVFLELEEGIEGLVHVSELSQEKVANPREFTTIDAELEAVVINVDTDERKIGLSIKSLQSAMEKAEIAEYLGSQGQATSNLGDLLKDLKKNGE